MALNGYEKAAIFLRSLGEEVAAEILKSLEISEIGKITMHMTRIKAVSKNTVNEILAEASGMISKGDVHVGEEFAKKILSKGLGREDAEKIMEMASQENPLDSLNWVDSKTLSNFLLAEHPQTIALIISMLEPVKAAEALLSLPDGIKAEVAIRIATTERITDTAIREINEVLKGQLDITKNKGKKLGGTKKIAEILNNCDRATEHVVLSGIEEKNNTLADSIRQLMFVFEDLVNVEDRGIQAILKEVSADDLSLALKTTSDALKDKIFRNMSKRAATILKEEMETKGPVKVSDVEKAQQSIVKVARKLEEEGRIIISGKGGEELVV